MAVQNRVYPAPAQLPGLSEHCGHARYVWNLAVEQQSWWRPGRGPAPSSAERYRQLAEARQAEPWLAAGSSSVQQQALRDFDRALAAFFDPKNPASRPAYRSKHRTQGFAVRDTRARRISRRWGEVLVPKVGWVRFRWTRQLPGKLGICRVTCDRAGRWHVSFPSPQPAMEREPAGRSAGIDRGVRTALVTSAGQHYRAPRISGWRAARYLALQRKLARQRKGSKDRENDLIVLEQLNIAGMARRPAPKPDPGQPGTFLPNRARAKTGLSRGILASCWGLLGRRLQDKAAASGVQIVFVHPRFTSQQCHACGHIQPENRESQAVFLCLACGHGDHADRNAALNILARGLLLLATGELVPAHAPGHGALRRHQPAQAAAGTTLEAA